MTSRNLIKPRIAIKNCDEYLDKPGYLFLVVKASSIDALKSKQEVFEDQTRILEHDNFDILQEIRSRTVRQKSRDDFG